jgi:amino acid transporter
MVDQHAYGTQSDAYAAENDLVPRSTEKGRKMSLAKDRHSSEGGVVNDSDDVLAAMGYKSELVRSRSTLQVAFMSFVLASIPYGLATTLYYPVVNGGPVTIIWGWLAVSCIILCVAASLGEITSVYPTSGGVYYQTFMLAAPAYRKIASWICGWCFVVGNITITLSVNFATALFYVACVNVFESEPGVGIFEGNTWQVYLIFLGVTLLCNVVCAFGNKWLPWLDVSIPHPHADTNVLLTALRPLPFSGPLVASLPSSFAYLPLRKTVVIAPATSSPPSTLPTPDGFPAGPSWSDSSTQPTRHPPPE